MEELKYVSTINLRFKKNIGFSQANNIAINEFRDSEWILILNPDARIECNSMSELLDHANIKENKKVGIFSVPLMRYDYNNKGPLHVYDSYGIKCTAIGRWIDIKSNQQWVDIVSNKSEYREALCGAFLFVRREALNKSKIKGVIGFDSSLYMYKEDIELCLRLKNNGWDSKIYLNTIAYHCRGWNGNRSDVPYWGLKRSANNDIIVASRYKWRALPFAVAKFLWVSLVEKNIYNKNKI